MEAGQHVDEPDVWLTNPEYKGEVYDAITGAQLDPSLVPKVRNAEMTFLIDQLNAFKYDTVGNCLKTTGRRPIQASDTCQVGGREQRGHAAPRGEITPDGGRNQAQDHAHRCGQRADVLGRRRMKRYAGPSSCPCVTRREEPRVDVH